MQPLRGGQLIAGSRDSTLGVYITHSASVERGPTSLSPADPTKTMLFLPVRMYSLPKLVGYHCLAGAWPLHQGDHIMCCPSAGNILSQGHDHVLALMLTRSHFSAFLQ